MAVLKGKGTKVRWAVLASGITARPSTGLTLLTGVQNTSITGNQELDDTPSGDYDSATDLWRDGDSIRSLGWTMSLDGHSLDTAANREQFADLKDAWAAGSHIWIERQIAGSGDWEGGRALIQDPGQPVPYDGEVTWSVSLLGQGALVTTPNA